MYLYFEFLLITFICYFYKIDTQTPDTTSTKTVSTSTIPPNTTPHPLDRKTIQYFGTCNCDLTKNVCDLNCCCDASCLPVDLEVFQCNKQIQTTTSKQWCVPSSTIFLQNTPYIINSLGDLLCVDLNNSLAMNYYDPPLLDTIQSKETFVTNLANSIYPESVYSNPYFSIQTPNTNYSFNSSDFVWSIFPNNNLNYLVLPIQIGSNCRDGPPVYYLKNKESRCIIRNSNILSECSGSTTSTLSFNYFLSALKLIRKPNSLKNCLNDQLSPIVQPFDYYKICDEKYLTSLNIRTCKYEDGTLISEQDCKSFLKPSLTNNVCKNLVKSVTYILRFKNPNGTIEAGLDVVFFNFDTSQTNNVEQIFKIVFIPDTITLQNFDSVYSQKLSGNPGYLRDQPILASSSANTNDRNKRFTYLKPSSNGNCPKDDSFRDFIKFNENVFTECIYKPNIDPNLGSYCNLLQAEIDNIILGYAIDKRATRFSPFADSDPNSWNLIRNSEPSSQPSGTSDNGVCRSIRIGATIQIAYALVGNVINPQAELQYIAYNWNELIDINLKCSGQFCLNLNNLRLKISTRITFVDVSQPPLYSESQVARPKTYIPDNFFFPLTSKASKQNVYNRNHFYAFVLFFLFKIIL